MARLWKTKYPLAVRKIGEYATGLLGNSGRKILCLIEIPWCQAQAARDFMDLRGRVNTCT